MYRKMCILFQQTSPKRWFGNRTITSNCDVTNSAHQIKMTTLCHWMTPPWKFSAYATADVTSCAQLLVFLRYIHLGDNKEELLFCEEQQTTSADALELINTFFRLGRVAVEIRLWDLNWWSSRLQWWDYVRALKIKFN